MTKQKRAPDSEMRRKQKRPLKPSTLRIGAPIGIPEVLHDLGENPSEVLAEIGFDLSLFDNPNNQITYHERGRMMAHCAIRANCPHFGLLVGQKAGLVSLGIVGLLARYSPNVGKALNGIVRFMHLHVRGARAALSVGPEQSVFEYQIYQVRSPGNQQVGDGAVAAILNILQELCGSRWEAMDARFAHHQPEDISPYQEFFRAPLYFNAKEYGVAFSTSLLGLPLRDTDPDLLQMIQQEIDKQEAQSKANFLDQLRSLLRTTLVTGHATSDQVAEILSMNRRTLSRHLKALGTSFREVADEVRFEIARQLLEDSSMEIDRIALFLGYSNASAFTRAFRRWSSTTPSEWRVSTTK